VIFSGIEFAFFLPLVLAAYWLLPRKSAWQNGFLLGASYLFYASWSLRLLPLLLVATAVDYLAGLAMDRHRTAAESEGPDAARARLRMRVALGASLAYNIGQLCYFKYSGFFAESLNQLLSAAGLAPRLPVLKLLLPLGISFYTFQKLAYIIDVYYGRQAACRSPLEFATFVAFFPQLIAGPITRAGDLLPQLAQARVPDADRMRAGAATFFLGFIKKAYVADYLAQNLVDPMFAASAHHSTAGHWLALCAYALQLYCDFSGYSEMAIGCGRLLGIELPRNFDYPYLSKNLIEFWRRWHITLNTWFFDYIYGPLTTGSGFMRGRLDAGFGIVFLVSGLWHGASWTFVLWGGLHGLALIATRRWDVFYRGLCRQDRAWVARRKSTAYAGAAWFSTQVFFILTLVPFRAPSLAAAGSFLKALFVPQPGLLMPDVIPPAFRLNLLACFTFVIAHHLLELERGRALRDRFFALPPLLRGTTYGLVIVYLHIFLPLSTGTFVYAMF